jgi:Protein of unknown function (DUF3037)
MSNNIPYTYIILRYVHDVMTGEFVNVGVVMHVPTQRRVLAKTRTTMGRIRGVFPDLDRNAFSSSMQSVQRSFRDFAKENAKVSLFVSDGDAATFARKAVPADDSSLQWSPVGSGLTSEIDRTFDRLYDRFVSRYDTPSRHRRTDDDVWRPVLQKLEEKNLASLLQEKVIAGPVDDVLFKHAWKNGSWHVYEPVSFDLADADGIKVKAREWLGHLAAVVTDGKNVEPFKPHFIVGAPRDEELRQAYKSALAILRRVPNEPEIFEETQIDDLVAQIEQEVRLHESSTR